MRIDLRMIMRIDLEVLSSFDLIITTSTSDKECMGVCECVCNQQRERDSIILG